MNPFEQEAKRLQYLSDLQRFVDAHVFKKTAIELHRCPSEMVVQAELHRIANLREAKP